MKQKVKLNGTITMEASFIVPFYFIAMITFLYVGMYLHDKYVIENVIRTAVQREMRYILQEETVEDGRLDWSYWGEKSIIWYLTADLKEEKSALRKYIAHGLEKKLFLAENPDIDIEMETEQISVLYRSSVQWSMPFLALLINGSGQLDQFLIEGEVQIIGIKAQEWIRMCRGLLTPQME